MWTSRTVVLAMLLAPLACAAGDWALRMDGIGPLQVGMGFDEANVVLGKRLEHTPLTMRDSPDCDEIELPGHKGVYLMFVDDVLVRVDMWEAGDRTDAGVEVGGPVQQVFDAYAHVAAQRHAYDESERYLTVPSPDGKLAIRFETLHGKVGGMYAGRYQAIQYIEGCL